MDFVRLSRACYPLDPNPVGNAELERQFIVQHINGLKAVSVDEGCRAVEFEESFVSHGNRSGSDRFGTPLKLSHQLDPLVQQSLQRLCVGPGMLSKDAVSNDSDRQFRLLDAGEDSLLGGQLLDGSNFRQQQIGRAVSHRFVAGFGVGVRHCRITLGGKLGNFP